MEKGKEKTLKWTGEKVILRENNFFLFKKSKDKIEFLIWKRFLTNEFQRGKPKPDSLGKGISRTNVAGIWSTTGFLVFLIFLFILIKHRTVPIPAVFSFRFPSFSPRISPRLRMVGYFGVENGLANGRFLHFGMVFRFGSGPIEEGQSDPEKVAKSLSLRVTMLLASPPLLFRRAPALS